MGKFPKEGYCYNCDIGKMDDGWALFVRGFAARTLKDSGWDFCLRQADYGTVDVIFLLGLLFIFESIRDTEIFIKIKL